MRDLFQVLLLVPVIRLTRPVVDPRVVPGLFMLGPLFTLRYRPASLPAGW